jgi:hypothetical protein
MVLDDGSLYASAANISGTITANSGSIAGWEISEDSISTGELFGEESFHMYPKGHEATSDLIGGEEIAWALGIGRNFGVTKGGNLYCSGGEMHGSFYPQNIYGESFYTEWKENGITLKNLSGAGGLTISPTQIDYNGEANIRFAMSSEEASVLGKSLNKYLWAHVSVPDNSGVITFKFWWQDENGVQLESQIEDNIHITIVSYKKDDGKKPENERIIDTLTVTITPSEFHNDEKTVVKFGLKDGLGYGDKKYFYWAIRIKDKEKTDADFYDGPIRYGDFGDESGKQIQTIGKFSE